VDDSNVWTPNCLVSVTDQRLNVDDTLLIKDVYFSYSVDQGSVTELIMVKKDSYQMAPDSPLSLGFLGLFS
jgi:prophage tail gpP-like protein